MLGTPTGTVGLGKSRLSMRYCVGKLGKDRNGRPSAKICPAPSHGSQPPDRNHQSSNVGLWAIFVLLTDAFPAGRVDGGIDFASYQPSFTPVIVLDTAGFQRMLPDLSGRCPPIYTSIYVFYGDLFGDVDMPGSDRPAY